MLNHVANLEPKEKEIEIKYPNYQIGDVVWSSTPLPFPDWWSSSYNDSIPFFDPSPSPLLENKTMATGAPNRRAVALAGTNGIAYGNNIYILVGNISGVTTHFYYRSVGNPKDWGLYAARAEDGTALYINTVDFHDGYFYIVCKKAQSNSQVYRSVDGREWNFFLDLNMTITSAVMGPGVINNKLFIICAAITGSSNNLVLVDMITKDIQATNIDPVVFTTIRGIAYDGNTFVAVGSTNSIYSSSDAITWTKNPFTGTASITLSVSYGNGIFLVLRNGSYPLLKSNDGVNWTEVGPSVSYTRIIYFGNTFVCTSGSLTFSTDDGEVFTQLTGYITPPSASVSVVKICNNILFFGTSSSIPIAYTSDLVSFYTDINGFSSANTPVFIKYKNKYIIAPPNGIYISEDFIVWKKVYYSPVNTIFSDYCIGQDDRLVLINTSGLIFSTLDGETWDEPSVLPTLGLAVADAYANNISYGNGKYVVASKASKIDTSADLINWNSQVLSGTNTFVCTEFYKNNFYIFGGGTHIYISPDGINWTLSSSTLPITSVSNTAIHKDKLYVVGPGIARSENGTNWNTLGPPRTDISIAIDFYDDNTAIVGGQQTPSLINLTTGDTTKFQFGSIARAILVVENKIYITGAIISLTGNRLYGPVLTTLRPTINPTSTSTATYFQTLAPYIKVI